MKNLFYLAGMLQQRTYVRHISVEKMISERMIPGYAICCNLCCMSQYQIGSLALP